MKTNEIYVEYDANKSDLPKGLKLCLKCLSKFSIKHECFSCNPKLYSNFETKNKYILNKKNCVLELTCPVCEKKYKRQRSKAKPNGFCSKNCYRLFIRKGSTFNLEVTLKNKVIIEKAFNYMQATL